MPSVTLDGRSFLIDGRRVWLVSGRVPYARIPRDQWAKRIHAAKLAGLNCIETPIFWSRHEPRPGRFDFTGENDLRYFIDLVGKAGMYCILGVGPFVGSEYDFGGLPAWLREQTRPDHTDIPLRTNGQFLEACSRFITAVSEQVRGWQVTAMGSGGPIILLQVENEWTCGKQQLADQYLGELTRYLREAGLTVPIVNSNNLWQNTEGQIDGWVGNHDLLGMLRQLAAVRPNNPRIVIDFASSKPDVFGRIPAPSLSPLALERRLLEVLAGAAQFNLTSFCGGTNFGFTAGRADDSPHNFYTPAADHACAIDQTGEPTTLYNAIRRVALFGAKFGRVLANLDPVYHPIVLKPVEDADVIHEKPARGKSFIAPPPEGCSVIHAHGSQGAVAFIFGDEPEGETKPGRTLHLLLPDGEELIAPLPKSGLTWCLLNVSLTAKARLDYCNLAALGIVGSTFVAFGPAGSTARLSINGAPMEETVPAGTPKVVQHEGLTIVLLDEDIVDHTYFADDAVYVGVSGLTLEAKPIPAPGFKSVTRIGNDGKATTIAPEGAKGKPAAKSPAKPAHEKIAIANWSIATMDEHIDGSSARYATGEGLKDLTTLGSPNGYGWYRITVKGSGPRKAHTIAPQSGDRLHFFEDSKRIGLIGVGPGATVDAELALKKGPVTFVVLAENFGRFCGGSNLGEHKGIFGHLLEAKELKPAKPKMMAFEPLNILGFRSPLWEIAEGELTASDRLTYTITGKQKTDLVAYFNAFPTAALLVVNDKPLCFMDRSGPYSVIIPADLLNKPTNIISIAAVESADADSVFETIANNTRFFHTESALTEKAEVAFAKWEPPTASAYEPLKGKAPAKPSGLPAWFKATFTAPAAPVAANGGEAPNYPALFIEPHGMTKGQIYINGKHLCKFFVATGNGKPVPPQDRYYIPASFLKPGVTNEVLIFDEHGASPSKAIITT